MDSSRSVEQSDEHYVSPTGRARSEEHAHIEYNDSIRSFEIDPEATGTSRQKEGEIWRARGIEVFDRFSSDLRRHSPYGIATNISHVISTAQHRMRSAPSKRWC